MGDSIQKTLQRRGDKKRQIDGIRDLLILFLLLLPILSLVTNFVSSFPEGFRIYSFCLVIYLFVERLIHRDSAKISIQQKFRSSKDSSKKNYKGWWRSFYGKVAAPRRNHEFITAIIVVIATFTHTSSEKWPHLLYFFVVLFAGIMSDFRFTIYSLLIITIVEIPHLKRGDAFEIALFVSVILSGLVTGYFTGEIKKKKQKAEEVLQRIKDRAEMYEIEFLEGEDLSGHALQQIESFDKELAEVIHIIKDSLYADGAHLLLPSPKQVITSTINSDKFFCVVYTTDRLVLYETGIVQRIADEGIPRLITFDSKRLSPGYATTYEINTLLAVPVKEGKSICGVLAIDSIRKYSFTERDLEIMERYASLISAILMRQRITYHREKAEKIIKLLHNETGKLTTTIRPEELSSLIIESCYRISPSSTIAFLLRDSFEGQTSSKGQSPFRIIGKRINENSDISLQIKPNFIASNPFYSLISEEKRFLYIPSLKSKDFSFLPFYAKNAASLLAIPLWYEHGLLGLIVFLSGDQNAYTQEQIEVLRVYANQASIAFQNAKLYREIENMATTDGLTGLFNHRKFQEELERELKRHERFGKPLSLCLLDIDFFKKINDTHGHPAGDFVLRTVARIIKETFRSTDIPARYGGEEFAIILIDLDSADARSIAERLRARIQSHIFSYNGIKMRVTVSIGIATSLAEQRIPKALLIERADKALYHAKHTGRNKTVVWDEM